MLRPVVRRAQQASGRHAQQHRIDTADVPVPPMPAAAHAGQQQRRASSSSARALMPHVASVPSAASPAAAASSSSALLLTRRSFHSWSLRRSEEEDQAAKIAAHRERIRLKREADKAAAAAGPAADAAAPDAGNESPKTDEVPASKSKSAAGASSGSGLFGSLFGSKAAPAAKPKKQFADEAALDEVADRGAFTRVIHWFQDQWHGRLPESLTIQPLRVERNGIKEARYGRKLKQKHAPSTPEYWAALAAEEAEEELTATGKFEAKFMRQARPQPKKTVVKDADWISAALHKSKLAAEQASAEAKDKEEEDEAELTRVEDPTAYTGSTALMVVENEGGMLWADRLGDIDESIRGTFRVFTRPILRKIFSIEPLGNLRDKVKEKIAEAQDEWENSQDPRVWQARDLQDKISQQTETSLAMQEILSVDPTFTEADFLREMEEFMIPEVIGAYRVGDMKLLQSVVDGPATSQILMHLRTRAAEKREWDPRILDIKGVDIVKASLADDVPYIQLTFVCQHINRDTHSETGEVIESEPKPGQTKQATGTIATFYYSWALRKDYESKYYNWKIIDFQAQHVGLLA